MSDKLSDEQLPCPFCGCTDISEGEVLTDKPDGGASTQSMCRGCGALGPEANLRDGEVDYGSVKATAAWNRRASPAPQTAAEMMVAVRNAQMFMDVRSIIATCADRKARAPYRHVEAQRVLPLLDGFLGVGYTGRVMAFKRALAAPPAPAISEGKDTERLDFMATWGARVVWSRDGDVCWIVRYEDDDGELVSKRLSAAFDTPRAAIDAARAGGKS
ncbi:MAG: Lar family restriction alleviation protein [Burkholderia gladioli]